MNTGVWPAGERLAWIAAPECEVAIAPDRVIPTGEPGGIGFKFDRLGPRVPAIVVSAYTPPQTRLHRVFEHTSILSTVINRLGLPQGKLGARQPNAPDLGEAMPLANPRQDRPPIAKPTFSVIEDAAAEWHSIVHSKLLGAKQKPITDLQRTALHGVALLTQVDDLHNRIAKIENELEADLLLVEHEAKFVKNKIF